ncbi:MAG: hypothetical protein JRI80_00270 [Deltaproteobacteria bacterium]|nr:hypothetical protein [Deltaproteobacteria bacterium]
MIGVTALRAIAAAWLRYDQHCDTILFERPETIWGRPDVFGIRADGRATEIEIKVSVSDFKADTKKAKNLDYGGWGQNAPHLFYYIVPAKLTDKILLLMQDAKYKGKGLLSHHPKAINGWTKLPLVEIKRRATRNPNAGLETWKGYPVGRDMAGTICSLAKEIAHLQSTANKSLFKRIVKLRALLWDIKWLWAGCGGCHKFKGMGAYHAENASDVFKRLTAEFSSEPAPEMKSCNHADGTLFETSAGK